MYVGDKQILESGSHEELLAKKVCTIICIPHRPGNRVWHRFNTLVPFWGLREAENAMGQMSCRGLRRVSWLGRGGCPDGFIR